MCPVSRHTSGILWGIWPAQPTVLTCNEILLLPAGVQQPATHGSGWSRVDELYVLVRALEHLGSRGRREWLVKGSPHALSLMTQCAPLP